MFARVERSAGSSWDFHPPEEALSGIYIPADVPEPASRSTREGRQQSGELGEGTGLMGQPLDHSEFVFQKKGYFKCRIKMLALSTT